ncbi:zinc-specific metallo-regulatory protein [Insulibacter thermoxylanivorax]|uniref:Zinc-specific metallo-regulatory protein n=2 Tax=Insulibacter thermoxylanivorax TaxID=2749268 RepID=A0A916VFG4_9BACL|nr:Fur family transcriptional regulator [Insulibacter thermoxylanivorax]GFR37356.1 zinc-specific metallo-regulatory protein [Insulibacter thermoxylanivorax]
MAEHYTDTQMLEMMAKHGWRITDQRRTLAQLFAESDAYLSPKDVYEYMKTKYPGVSFDTVYRNLRIMSEMGVLEQFYFLDGGLKFRGGCLTRHHHHVICTGCEKTLSLDYCPMEQSIELPDDFQVMNHRFEIYGLCRDCQSDSDAAREQSEG